MKFLWNSSIVGIHGKDDWRLESVDIQTPEGQVNAPADFVIQAVGSVPASRIVSTTEGIEVDEKGYVLTRENPYGMTTRKGVFA